MQGHSRLTSDAKAASSLCPENLHCIQGAGAVDLLEEMQWPVGQEGSARLLIATDDTLDEGARFQVEVNGGVPVHIDESFDKYNQHYRQVQPAPAISKVAVVYYCCCGGPGAHAPHRRRRC
jgi:hypothetical protein